MACLIVNSMSFCQTLKPTKIQKDSAVYRCFDELQTKAIVKIIVGKQYCDSIQDVNAQMVAIQDSIINSQKGLVKALRSINENNQGQITNLNILNQTLKSDLSKAQSQVSKMKRRRWLYFGAGILSASTVVYLSK